MLSKPLVNCCSAKGLMMKFEMDFGKRRKCRITFFINKVMSEAFYVIKSKLLVFGAVSTTINDQGCQHVTKGFESIRTPFKQVGQMAYICSVASLSKNCRVIQKTSLILLFLLVGVHMIYRTTRAYRTYFFICFRLFFV